MRIRYVDDKKVLEFGYCYVIEGKEGYVTIHHNGKILTHESKWKRATKIASLLQEAYEIGYRKGYEEGEE